MKIIFETNKSLKDKDYNHNLVMTSEKLDSQKFARIESILNPSNGNLPFGYYAPETDGRLTWNCGTDIDNKIISVFCFDDGVTKDKKVVILSNMADALYARDELIKAGWKKLEPPKITVKHEDGTETPLTRKQKRQLARTVDKMAKNNPFGNDTENK